MNRRPTIALLAGILNVAVVFAAAFVLRSMTYGSESPLVVVFLGFSALVTFLLGAAPAYLLVRFRVVLPLLFSASLTARAVLDRGALHDFVEVFFVPPFALVVAGLVAAVAAIELGVRYRFAAFPPEPLL